MAVRDGKRLIARRKEVKARIFENVLIGLSAVGSWR
jgi:hypothetical protein